MLDSGTTFTYLRLDAFSLISTQFNNFCKIQSTNGFAKCGKNNLMSNVQKYCVEYDQAHYKNLENFFNSFPKLYFKLGAVQIIWFAKDYLTKAAPTPTGK